MSWKRGKGSVEVELANVQSYIEMVDPDLRGDGKGDPGVIQIVRAGQNKKEQHDEDLGKVFKLLGFIGFGALSTVVIEILRMFAVVK